MKEDEMIGWHYQLNRHESEQTQGDGEGQGSLACCSPLDRRVEHYLVTEQQQEFKSKAPKYLILTPEENY